MRAYAYTRSTPVRNGVAQVNALKVYRRRTVFTTETRRACGEVHAHVYTKTWMLGSRVLLGKSPIPARRTIPGRSRSSPAQRAELFAYRSRRQREGPYRQDVVRQSRGHSNQAVSPQLRICAGRYRWASRYGTNCQQFLLAIKTPPLQVKGLPKGYASIKSYNALYKQIGRRLSAEPSPLG